MILHTFYTSKDFWKLRVKLSNLRISQTNEVVQSKKEIIILQQPYSENMHNSYITGQKILKSPDQKNSWNQINEFHDFTFRKWKISQKKFRQIDSFHLTSFLGLKIYGTSSGDIFRSVWMWNVGIKLRSKQNSVKLIHFIWRVFLA